MHRAIAILILLALSVSGATYYISPAGNDSTGNGSVGSPWLTYSNAFRTISAGDTLLVQPGIYGAGNENFYGNLRMVTSGSENSRITVRANGVVTNAVPFEVIAGYYTFDGFIWQGSSGITIQMVYPGGSMPGPGAHHVIVTNCTFQYGEYGGVGIAATTDHLPENSPSFNQIINCTFRNLTNSTAINISGVSNVVSGCVISDCGSCDAFRLMGSNNVVRLCTITNLHAADGFGNHPDVIQFFGDNGDVSSRNLFERNLIVGGAGYQLMDLSYQSTGKLPSQLQTNNAYWGLTFQNNVVQDCPMQCSIDVPNLKFYNNTFRRCSSVIAFAFYDENFYVPSSDAMTNETWMCRGWADGGEVRNNAFIESAGYNYSSVGPLIGTLTNGAGQVKGYAKMFQSSGFSMWGQFTNVTETVTNVTISVGGSAYYNVTNINGEGKFYRGVSSSDPLLNGHTYEEANSAYVNELFTAELRLDDGTIGASTALKAYAVPAVRLAALTNACTYNFGQAGVNTVTGVTNLVGATNFPAGLAASMRGCVLIDAGTNITDLGVTNDFFGVARPQGGAFDVGAFEYDPGLLVHFDFDESLAARVLDTTGNTNHAWQMDSTNWITSSNGVFGTAAGNFKYVGTYPDGYAYQYSQYGALTNLNGLALLTNATISVWAKIDANGDYVLELLDCAATPTTGSWTFGRDSTPYLCFNVVSGGSSSPRINFPDDVVQSGGGSPDLSTAAFHNYAVTINSNTVIGYYDGAPIQTNTVGTDHLVTAGWLALGAMAHSGTPQWVDDGYPNAGFFVGKMDDVRIYNRTLSAAEMASLYTGLGGTSAASEGGTTPPDEPPIEPPATNSPAASGSATATRIYVGTLRRQ